MIFGFVAFVLALILIRFGPRIIKKIRTYGNSEEAAEEAWQAGVAQLVRIKEGLEKESGRSERQSLYLQQEKTFYEMQQFVARMLIARSVLYNKYYAQLQIVEKSLVSEGIEK